MAILLFNNKIQLGIFFTTLLLLCGFSSCSPEIYNPNSLNVPLLSQKGNTKIALSTTLGVNQPYNNNLQMASAITDHFAIMVNGMYHNYTSSYGSTIYRRHKEGFAEAGIGYYGCISNDSKLRGEIYGGWGLGKAKDKHVIAPYNRVFVQPSLGFVSKYFDVALSIRASYLTVGKIDARWDRDLDGKVFSGGLIEPCITLYFGHPIFKPFIQYSRLFHSPNLKEVISMDAIIARFITAQVGIKINLNK